MRKSQSTRYHWANALHRSLLAALLSASASVASAQTFRIDTISDAVFQRMQGHSYPADCRIARSELRYLTVSHIDRKGQMHTGELVCNKRIAADLIDIFRQLYKAKYPIERMRLIDDYDADDERSMQANNTSCFCYRAVSGSQKLSKHAQGLAIDINPLYNPYLKGTKVQPANARPYCNRAATFPYKIVQGDLLHRLFLSHGFRWGGAWRSLKDYQHFER